MDLPEPELPPVSWFAPFTKVKPESENRNVVSSTKERNARTVTSRSLIVSKLLSLGRGSGPVSVKFFGVGIALYLASHNSVVKGFFYLIAGWMGISFEIPTALAGRGDFCFRRLKQLPGLISTIATEEVVKRHS